MLQGLRLKGLCQVNVIMLRIVPAHHISTLTIELCHKEGLLEGPVYGSGIWLGGVCPF